MFAFDERVDKDVVADLDRLAEVMARQRPAWKPGSRPAYRALTLGFYENELMRRVDPLHRTAGRYFQEEIASPLGADTFFRLPEAIPISRLAKMQMASIRKLLFGMPFRLLPTSMNPRSPIFRALIEPNPGTGGRLRRRTRLRQEFRGPFRRRREQRAWSGECMTASREAAAKSACTARRWTR